MVSTLSLQDLDLSFRGKPNRLVGGEVKWHIQRQSSPSRADECGRSPQRRDLHMQDQWCERTHSLAAL